MLEDCSVRSKHDMVVKPACSEGDMNVRISVWCMCVLFAYVHLSRYVRAITCTFMHGFQIIWNSCFPGEGEVQFEPFIGVG